ncbi:MAG: hypothetical protein M3Q87_04220 [Actinomycetota bacterium]|nr:hypothetical protein [Actinomycetota bacterium]
MRSLALVCAVLASSVLASAPVSAETRGFRDDDRAGGGTGVTSFRVQNAVRAMRVDVRHERRLAVDDVWIDSRAGDRGPEYRVRLIANSDNPKPLRRVEGFGSANGRPWRCRGAELRSDDFEPRAVSHLAIPQRCIAGPGRVRLHVDSYGNGTGNDHAPDKGTHGQGYFTPWITLG